MAWSVSFLANKNVLCGLWWCLYTLNLFKHWRERNSSGKDPEGFSWGSLCLSPDASTMARGKKLWVCLLLPSSAGDFDPWVGKIPWSRKWQLTPVFSPGKFHRQRSLEGYSLCGHKELDTMSDWVHMLCFCMWLEAEGRGRDSFHKGWRKQKTHN